MCGAEQAGGEGVGAGCGFVGGHRGGRWGVGFVLKFAGDFERAAKKQRGGERTSPKCADCQLQLSL